MTDALFVHVPGSWRFPAEEWCLGYRYLVAALRSAGFSAGIVHPPFVTDGTAGARLVAGLVAREPRIVGLTTYDAGLPALLDLVAEMRRAGLRAHVTLGGLCATAAPEWILERAPGVDSIVRGEGERTIVDLADHVIRGTTRLPIPGATVRAGTGIVSGEPRPFLKDLDDLPRPMWDAPARGEPARDGLVTGAVSPPPHRRPDVAPVIGSRGCYGRCSSCGIERFYRSSPRSRPWRGRSAARIADDVADAVRATGVHEVTFVDENFMGPGRSGRLHAVQIADELVRRGRPAAFSFACRADDVDRDTFGALKDAGLRAVILGIESMSQSTLELFRKNTTPQVNARALEVLTELGVDTEIRFVFFNPLSTLDDVRTGLAFVSQVARLPGTCFTDGQPYTEFVPFVGTSLTALLAGLGYVHGSVGDYSLRYSDARVGFLARTATGVPLDDLAMLQLALPAGRDARAAEARARLSAYHRHLALHRLPELLSDACDAFAAGAGESDPRLLAVVAALDAESTRIRSLVDRFVAHLPAGVTRHDHEGRGGTPAIGERREA